MTLLKAAFGGDESLMDNDGLITPPLRARRWTLLFSDTHNTHTAHIRAPFPRPPPAFLQTETEVLSQRRPIKDPFPL